MKQTLNNRNNPDASQYSQPVTTGLVSDFEVVEGATLQGGGWAQVYKSSKSILMVGNLGGQSFSRRFYTPKQTPIHGFVALDSGEALLLSNRTLYRYAWAPGTTETDHPMNSLSLTGVLSMTPSFIVATPSTRGKRVIFFAASNGVTLFQIDDASYTIEGYLTLTSVGGLLYGGDDVLWLRYEAVESLRTGHVLIGTRGDGLDFYQSLVDLSTMSLIRTWDQSNRINKTVSTGEILYDLDEGYAGQVTPPVLAVKIQDTGKAVLSWDQSRSDLVVSYEIQLDLDDSGFVTIATNPSGSMKTYTFEAWNPNSKYAFRVRAVTNEGLSEWSNTSRLLRNVNACPVGAPVGPGLIVPVYRNMLDSRVTSQELVTPMSNLGNLLREPWVTFVEVSNPGQLGYSLKGSNQSVHVEAAINLTRPGYILIRHKVSPDSTRFKVKVGTTEATILDGVSEQGWVTTQLGEDLWNVGLYTIKIDVDSIDNGRTLYLGELFSLPQITQDIRTKGQVWLDDQHPCIGKLGFWETAPVMPAESNLPNDPHINIPESRVTNTGLGAAVGGSGDTLIFATNFPIATTVGIHYATSLSGGNVSVYINDVQKPSINQQSLVAQHRVVQTFTIPAGKQNFRLFSNDQWNFDGVSVIDTTPSYNDRMNNIHGYLTSLVTPDGYMRGGFNSPLLYSDEALLALLALETMTTVWSASKDALIQKTLLKHAELQDEGGAWASAYIVSGGLHPDVPEDCLERISSIPAQVIPVIVAASRMARTKDYANLCPVASKALKGLEFVLETNKDASGNYRHGYRRDSVGWALDTYVLLTDYILLVMACNCAYKITAAQHYLTTKNAILAKIPTLFWDATTSEYLGRLEDMGGGLTKDPTSRTGAVGLLKALWPTTPNVTQGVTSVMAAWSSNNGLMFPGQPHNSSDTALIYAKDKSTTIRDLLLSWQYRYTPNPLYGFGSIGIPGQLPSTEATAWFTIAEMGANYLV